MISRNPSLRVRPLRPDADMASVSRIWKESLLLGGHTSYGNVQGVGDLARYVAASEQWLVKGSQRKAAAAVEARSIRRRLSHLHLLLGQGGSASASGVPEGSLRSSGNNQHGAMTQQMTAHNMALIREMTELRHQLGRLCRRRLWACLVAEDVVGDTCSHNQQQSVPAVHSQPADTRAQHGNQQTAVVGFLSLSLTQPLALLPPPFPSSTPRALKIDGLAVCPGHQRRGVGRMLLHAAERLARAWGRNALFLEVGKDNMAGYTLYTQHGYQVVRELSWPWRSTPQLLMRKMLPARGSMQAPERRTVASTSGQVVHEQKLATQGTKTFQWDDLE